MSIRRKPIFFKFPESLTGLSVLNIGAWDGFFSFEAEKRGAKRVVAYDLHPPDYYGFALAKELLGSQVKYIQGGVYDLSPEAVGTFDVVFFFGVFYHLRYPLLALDRIWSVTDQYMLMESHFLDNRLILEDGKSLPLSDIDTQYGGISLYQFYRYDELQPGDYSNWFAPNRHIAVESGLWTAGFRPEFLHAWGDRIAFKAVKLPGTPEYQRQTYEGLKWIAHQDGSQSLIFPPAIHQVSLHQRQDPSQANEQHGAAIAQLQAQEHGLLQGYNNLQQPDVLEQPSTKTQATVEALLELLKSSEARCQGMHEALRELHKSSEARCQDMQHVLQTIKHTRAYRLLHRLGRWRFMEQELAELPASGSWCPGDSASPALHLPTTQTLAAYKTAIDAAHTAQPNRDMLDRIRSHNHFVVDQMHAIRSLKGRVLLDIGASTWGYALERALEQGAALYVGIGLEMATSQYVLGDDGNVGLLLNMDAAARAVAGRHV